MDSTPGCETVPDGGGRGEEEDCLHWHLTGDLQPYLGRACVPLCVSQM